MDDKSPQMGVFGFMSLTMHVCANNRTTEIDCGRGKVLSTSTHSASIQLCVQRDGRLCVTQRRAIHWRQLTNLFTSNSNKSA